MLHFAAVERLKSESYLKRTVKLIRNKIKETYAENFPIPARSLSEFAQLVRKEGASEVGYLEEKNPKGKTGLHMRLNVLSHNSTK